MTFVDWFLVVGINGAIIAYGLYRGRETVRSVDWFLAAKQLPWWIVGLSMFATAVDSGDYVALAGGAYTFGLINITSWWLGLTVGWLIAAYFVFLPIYRMGMYTNAEYLEYRFGPAARVLSVLIQFQFRTNVLANISFSLYLTFSFLTGWGSSTWLLVVLIAVGAAVYTATGGIKSVALTDALQSVGMLAAGLTLWAIVWRAVGSWSGLQAKLDAIEPALSDTMLRVGGRDESGVPAILVVVGWTIILIAYCVVNHSQAMRVLSARSEWDMRMGALLAAVLTVAMGWFIMTIGILGKAIFPDLTVVDEIYPRLLNRFLGPGLIGLVVAGLLAGGISTYDSIGSSLSALFTRDLYARFLVKHRDDHHYLRVSRIFTFVMIAVSFVYIPFLQQGMVKFYLQLTRVAVIPLLVVYLMGTLTRVNRVSGTVGLMVGILFGLSSFLGAQWEWPLPIWWTNNWWACIWGVVVTATAMVITSMIAGWASEEEVRGLVYRAVEAPGPAVTLATPATSDATKATWLEVTRNEMPPSQRYPFEVPAGGLPWYKKPSVWAWLLVGVVLYLNLVVFW